MPKQSDEVVGYNPFNRHDDLKTYRENYRAINWNVEGPRYEPKHEEKTDGKAFWFKQFQPYYNVGLSAWAPKYGRFEVLSLE